MTTMLDVRDLHAYYGKSHILQGVSFDVKEGEIVSLLGRNGVGRSTTIKAIMGLVPPQGTVNYRGRNIAGMTPHEIAHQGLGYVPEDRSIFPTLTVRQNLLLGQKSTRKQGRWSVDDMYKLFPRLEERADTLAGVLSGGEQQMLTMCRTLLGDPDLIIPHRELLNRAFVLIPLATIRPDLKVAGERVADAAARFADDPIREIAPAWTPASSPSRPDGSV